MNWTLVSQKIEFQHQGSSILIGIFGITSVWRSHANILQQIIFRRYIVHFGGGKFGIVEKKTWKYCKKIQICKEFFYNGSFQRWSFVSLTSENECFLRRGAHLSKKSYVSSKRSRVFCNGKLKWCERFSKNFQLGYKNYRRHPDSNRLPVDYLTLNATGETWRFEID